MNKIESFKVDHTRLLPGLYVSRVDTYTQGFDTFVTTTFDIRMTQPNVEPVMNTAEIHTIEHLGATFVRNDFEYGDRVIYFGPMGCRTGFYLILSGEYTSKSIALFVISLFEYIRDYEGEIPGASSVECGNYLDMNLPMAKYRAKKYLEDALYSLNEDRLEYPI